MTDNEIENITKPITYEIISDFLKCEYKAYQKYRDLSGTKHNLEIVEQRLLNKYREQYFSKIKQSIPTEKILFKSDISKNIQLGCLFFESPFLQTSKFFIQFDAIEIKKADNKFLLPVMVSPKQKICKEDKVAFCASIILANKTTKLNIENGAIIHGKNLNRITFSIKTFKNEAQQLIEKIIPKISALPIFHNNRNCNSCEYYELCRKQLIEKDDLSLLGGFSKHDILDKNNRGIFSIFQFSHTYSAKRLKTAMRKKGYYPELKALALREKKTYIMEVPEIRRNNVELFFDFESLPDENFVYLFLIYIHQFIRIH